LKRPLAVRSKTFSPLRRLEKPDSPKQFPGSTGYCIMFVFHLLFCTILVFLPQPVLIASETGRPQEVPAAKAVETGDPTEENTSTGIEPADDPGPSFEVRARNFQEAFETAFAQDDRKALKSLIADNGALAMMLGRELLYHHLDACLRAGEALDRDSSPALARCEALFRYHARSGGHSLIAATLLEIQDWEMDTILRACDLRNRMIDIEARILERTREETLALFRKCLEESREIEDPLLQTRALIDVGAIQVMLEERDAALIVLSEALEMSEACGDWDRAAICLRNIGVIHYDMERFAQAREFFERSRDLNLAMGKWIHAASVEIGLLGILHAHGQTGEALERSRRLIIKLRKGDHLETLFAALTHHCMFLNDLWTGGSEALEASEEALQIADRLDNLRYRGMALKHKSAALRRLGVQDLARECLDEAIEIARQYNELSELGQELDSLANQLYQEGRYAEARAMAMEALELLGDKGKPRSQINLRLLLAALAESAWDLETADRWTAEAMAIGERLDSPVDLSSLNVRMAEHFIGRDRFDKALDCAERALELAGAPDLRVERAEALSILGRIYQRLGRHEKAIGLFERNLSELGDARRSNARAATLYKLASSLFDLGEHDDADRCLQESLELARELDDRPLIVGALNTSGRFAMLEKRYSDAEKIFLQSESICAGFPDPGMVRLAQLQRSEALIRIGRYGEARVLLEEIESAGLESHIPSLHAFSLGLRGLLRMAEGEYGEALGFLEESLRIQAEMARYTRSLPDVTRGAYADAFTWITCSAITCCHKQHGETDDAAWYERAFEIQENFKSRIYLDTLARSGLDIDPGVSRELKEEYAFCCARVTFCQKKREEILAHSPQAVPAEIAYCERALDEALNQLEKSWQRVVTEDPVYAALRSPRPVKLTAFQERLDSGTAFLSFLTADQSLLVLAVSSDACRIATIPVERDRLEREVGALLEMLSGESATMPSSLVRSARDLYRLILEPVEDVISKRRTLLIAADGVLNQLPFDVLLTEEPVGKKSASLAEQPLLLRRSAIALVPSASSYLYLRSLHAGREHYPIGDIKRYAGLGGVDYAGAALPAAKRPNRQERTPVMREKLEPLVHTVDEIRNVADMLPREDVTLFLGMQASESALLVEALPGHRIVHIAGHAIFEPDSPYLSCLVLSPDEGADGYVRIYEFFDCRTKAELVVLSACRTNLGRNLASAGTFGLVRAFLHAGAESVLATNWQVDDRLTPPFIHRFFEEMLTNGHSRAEALRLAKLAALEGRLVPAGDGKTGAADRDIRYDPGGGEGSDPTHPHNWAPFVIFGLP